MKAPLVATLLLSSTLMTTAALADDPAACADAALKAQTLRDAHHLIETREQLRGCVQSVCPTVVQSDCAKWLDEVENALPTLVITAKDESGRDLVNVAVSEEGRLLTSKLQGASLPLDPGVHALHFERPDGVTLDQQVVVKEGAKNQDVSVVIGNRRAAPPPAPASLSAGPWRAIGWVAGAIGVVGLGVGAAFGAKAISDKSDAHCDSSGACDPVALGNAGTAADISTAGILAGGVLLVGGASLVLLAPRPARSSAAWSVTPLVSDRGAGLRVGGTW